MFCRAAQLVSDIARMPCGVRASSRSICFVVLCHAVVARAQLPTTQLTTLFPPAGKSGSTVEVSLAGNNLEEVNQLVFSHPGITAAPKLAPDSTADKSRSPLSNRFVVTIAASVPPGLYDVRCIGKFGASNPRAFAVDTLAERIEPDPAAAPSAAKELPLESATSAALHPERADFYRFAAKKGQRVLIDCWARRIDSQLEPALVLTDAAGHELAHAQTRSRRDPLLDFAVPADGSYCLKISDVLFRGGPTDFYRLTLSTRPQLDFALPPAGLPGSRGKYTIYGRNLPGGQPTDFRTFDGRPLERIEVEIQLPSGPAAQQLPEGRRLEPSQYLLDAYTYRLHVASGDSNPLNIFYATAPVVAERDPNDDPARAQKLSLPCEVFGQFYPRGDQDWYTFDAKKGEAYCIEVYSQRMGVPADPYLLVQRVVREPNGHQHSVDLAEVDDPKRWRTDDDLFETFFNPRETTRPCGSWPPRMERIACWSAICIISRGNPGYVYRLAIRRPALPIFVWWQSPNLRCCSTPIR